MKRVLKETKNNEQIKEYYFLPVTDPIFFIKKAGGCPKVPESLIFAQLLDRKIIPLAVGSIFQKKKLSISSKHQMNEAVGEHQV